MPYHTSGDAKKMEKKSSPKKRPGATGRARALNATEKKLLKDIEGKHTKAHIKAMESFMKAGKGCFSQAHTFALRTVGK
jgi:CO dehydrogenase nickel-insertion accessory protein CooC1